MTDQLFPIDEIPEIPLMPPVRRGRGAQIADGRLDQDYPPEWHRCISCKGTGRRLETRVVGDLIVAFVEVETADICQVCLGMGSIKARVRLEAGHRCVRCRHPYIPKGDAKMLGVDPTPYHWSPCDDLCVHGGPVRYWKVGVPTICAGNHAHAPADTFEAEWRILTVHHLDGDKANLAWWNLAALCQRCHLEIQGRVVIERVYPHEHSDWFKPYAAGYYAHAYLAEDLTRDETMARLDELLALELAAT